MDFGLNRAAHVLFTIYPEELNKRSHGTNVAGTHSTVFTKLARTGKRMAIHFPEIRKLVMLRQLKLFEF